MQGKYVIVFEAFEKSDGFYYERHEEGNSKQNYDFDETYGFEFSMLTNHKGSLEAIAAETMSSPNATSYLQHLPSMFGNVLLKWKPLRQSSMEAIAA